VLHYDLSLGLHDDHIYWFALSLTIIRVSPSK